MRAFAIVLLAAVAVRGEAEADAYTMRQVALGLTHGGVITGVDYGNGVVSGVGAIGNRAVTYAYPAVHTLATHAVHPVATSAVYSNVVNPAVHTVAAPGMYSGMYSRMMHYGKREAEAEPEAEADPFLFTNNLVHHPVSTFAAVSPVAAVRTVVPAVGSVVPAVNTVAAVRTVAPAVSAVHTFNNVVSPVVRTVAPYATHGVYSNLGLTGFHHYGTTGMYGMYGKREAEAEPEAEADPFLFTNNLVHHPVSTFAAVSPVAAVRTVVPAVGSVVPAVNTVAAVRTIAPAVSAVHTFNNVVSPVVRTVAPYTTHGVYSNLGLTGFHHYGTTGMYGMYGKREAEAEPEPYTIGQVAAGLPVINAYATGHPHNIGYTTNVAHPHNIGYTTNVAHSVYPFTRFARFGYPHMF